MKKALSFSILLLLFSASVFASQRVSVSFNPFTYQCFVQKDGDTKTALKSKYGLGSGTSYNSESSEGFILGADLKADTYMIEDKQNFTDISLLAKAGYSYKADEVVSLFADMKLGLDMQIYEDKKSVVLELGPELGVDFKLKEHFDFFASCEFLFGFPGNNQVKYTVFRVTPVVGIGYTF